MIGIGAYKQRLPTPAEALAGREEAMPVQRYHYVHGRPIVGPFAGYARLLLGMGCFWGAERRMYALDGVLTTAVGYAGGYTPNPTYREVCSGRTGHAEVVLVVYEPSEAILEAILGSFWEGHDHTQGMRQCHDVGTQYRSAICWSDQAQLAPIEASRERYQRRLREAGYGPITTEIKAAGPFYYAEDEHQQYLAKNPSGYCGLGGTGVGCPLALPNAAQK